MGEFTILKKPDAYDSAPMAPTVPDLLDQWSGRIRRELTGVKDPEVAMIARWLVERNAIPAPEAPPEQWETYHRSVEFRYGILQQGYWGLTPQTAYGKLLQRLARLVTLRQKIQAWVAMGRDRRRTVVDVLQELLQELLHKDRHIQREGAWLAVTFPHHPLRNILLFVEIEEYALRPVRNLPLITYRFINFLKKSQRAGLTQVPTAEFIALYSEEYGPPDRENEPVSLFDAQAIAHHEHQNQCQEQHHLRQQIKDKFRQYLRTELGFPALTYFNLYLQGQTPEEIAIALGMSRKQVYRLWEKIKYHAIQVFATKQQPHLVSEWLQILIQEHNFGLTPRQWQDFFSHLSPPQQTIIRQLQQGQDLGVVGESLNLSVAQINKEWVKIYCLAQRCRNG